MRPVPSVTLILVLAVAAVASAAPEQITASAGDSRVVRFAADGSGRGAIVSTGDLTPGLPGNVDGSNEVWLVDFDSGGLTQVTASAGDSTALRVTADGDVIVSSQADLTPGAPGNDDGTYESWLWTRSSGYLQQLTATPFDTFFQAYFRSGRRAFFVSKGDLTPGDPGNADQANEVYTLNVDTTDFRQLTDSPRESLTRAIDPAGRYVLVQSAGDLTPGRPGNADGSVEVFVYGLDDLVPRQLTSSAGNTRYAGWSSDGRYLALTSDGDLVPGRNTDGSTEVFVLDLRRNRMRQITASDGDSSFAAFGPRPHRVCVHSRGDLVPGGNTDGSQEVYVANLRAHKMRQLTESSADSYLGGFAAHRRWAAVVSSGNLTPGAPGNADGSEEVFLVRIRPRHRATIQLTDGTEPVYFAGFDPKGRYVGVDTRADLIPGRNADGSREAYVATVRRRPELTQLTESATDSEIGSFLPDGRRVVLHSRADLDPSGPGNTDGSFEVFVTDLPQ